MSLKIVYERNTGYFIEYPNDIIDSLDLQMSGFFNIPYEKYIKMLVKYGAIEKGKDGYYFETEVDAQRFLNSEDLLPYLILVRLNE